VLDYSQAAARWRKVGYSHTMKLDLNLAPRSGAGRKAIPLEFEVVRPIDAADLELLSQPASTKPSQLKRLSDRHHSLARLLASGTPDDECAAIVGYTQSRVSVLKADPSFQELLSLYRKEVKTEFATSLEHMAGLSRDAILELRDRMEEEPGKFTNNELRALATELSDRTTQQDDRGAKLPDIIELVSPSMVPSPSGDDEGGSV